MAEDKETSVPEVETSLRPTLAHDSGAVCVEVAEMVCLTFVRAAEAWQG